MRLDGHQIGRNEYYIQTGYVTIHFAFETYRGNTSDLSSFLERKNQRKIPDKVSVEFWLT